MSKLSLILACGDYDRTRPLADGSVTADGIDLNVVHLPVEEIFFRMMRYREFDVAEMSMSSYVLSLDQPEPPFIAIPVFPSRMFRHSSIFVSAASGIVRPEDLTGKRVGLPEWQLTALVWIRGLLQDEYGVDPAGVRYFIGGEEEPGREEKSPVKLPEKFRVQRVGSGATLSNMIAEGKIDALYAPRSPTTLRTHPDKVRRLFPNFVEVERDYFRRTRVFPIMHVVVIRREIYEKHRWTAMSLFKAFSAAKRKAHDDLAETVALKTMLPWQLAHFDDTRRELGEEWWPYGANENSHTLELFLRYHHEQGLARTRRQVPDLFAPECLSHYRI